MMNRLARWSVMGRRDFNESLITVVKLSGVLQAFNGPAKSPAARRLLYLDRVTKWIERAFATGIKPAAVAISINSPGGSPVQSDLIHRLIRRHAERTKIPVYTFAEDVAASGGYWLMCAGDKAYGCETSLVGSIGVISASFGAVETAARLGIERRIYTAGESKSQLDPFMPVQPEQEARLRELMADLHESFKERVRGSRGERLAAGQDGELFSGRAWTGRQAVKLGLLDGVGDMHSVMRQQFGEKAKFLLCSEQPQPSFRDLFGLLGGTTALGHRGTAGEEAASGTGSALLAGLGGEEAAYGVCRAAAAAALDEADERALWSRFRLMF